MMIPSTLRVFIAKDPVDFRRSYDGLCGVVRDVLGADPESSALFVFRNRRSDQIKMLWNDGNGYAIWMKRLCRGTYKMVTTGEVSVEALALLLNDAKRQ